MTLVGVLEGLKLDVVLADLELTPLVAERVDMLAPPTEQELRILREEIDPARTIIGRTGQA
jgi:glutaconate CoA-transferase subunit B